MRKEYKRTLIKFSNYSLCVTLPKAMLKKLELDKGSEVLITLKRGKLIIEPATANGEAASTDQDNDNWEQMQEINEDEE
ncbi:MAG TPA: AbrB/MazE/SpoVT family DNA-binding domain-containing protein [Patescibacteria group bacterium]